MIETRIGVLNKGQYQPIKIYYHNGKKYVEARNKTQFCIDVKNSGSDTFLAVVSVDGLNIITGKKAVIEAKNGYVINPYSSEKFDGWRISTDKVREFVFEKNKEDTYSYKLNKDTSNNGVIAVAYFKEKEYLYLNWLKTGYKIWSTNDEPYVKYPMDNSWYNTSGDLISRAVFNTSCSVNLDSVSKSFSMGTSQGKEKESSVQYVSKEFEDTPYMIDVIYYDTYENLLNQGIISKEKKLPEPFLNSDFCPSL